MTAIQTKSRHSNTVLHDDLIEQILSFLTVKHLMRFRCVCKSWKTLISNPTFIKLHLKQSSTNRYITLIHDHNNIMALVRFPLTSLIDNHPITFVKDPDYHSPSYNFVGSCNGLICLCCYHRNKTFLYLWNPATKTLSNKIVLNEPLKRRWRFCFVHHESTDSYKIVAICPVIKEVKIFKVGDNVWRNIQSFPGVIVHMRRHKFSDPLNINSGVYVSDTVNWFLIRGEVEDDFEFSQIKIDQLMIVSLDLGTERYTEFILPSGFYGMKYNVPVVCKLMDSLCFAHDFEITHFIIWQMKEFGVQESWTQLFKINYLSLVPDYYNPTDYFFVTSDVIPIHLSEDGNTLILIWEEYTAIIYNLRDDRGEETRISNPIRWFCAKDYVESLVSIN